MLKKIALKTYQSLDWQLITISSIVFLLLMIVYVFRISSLLPGFAIEEKAFINEAGNIRHIFDNPLFAPHKILQYLAIRTDHNGFLAMRLPSILLGSIVVGVFYTVLRRWYSVFVSVVTTLLFATNAFYISNVRFASPEITILIAVILLAYGLWLNTRPSAKLAITAGIVVSVLVLYTPSLIWFYLAFLFWQKKNFVQMYHGAKKYFILSVIVTIGLLVPLFLSLLSSLNTAQTYIGLPAELGPALASLPKNILLIPYQLFWQGYPGQQLNLVGTPILDIFILAMFFLGGYYFFVENKKKVSAYVIAGVGFILVLIAINSSRYLVLLLPLVYLAVASGINEMLNKWYSKFPRNPIAKGLAFSLIILAVFSSCFYNLNKYFIAWPQTPATKIVFGLPPNPSVRSINIPPFNTNK